MLKPFKINEVSRYATAIDTPDSRENIFEVLRGGYPRLDGEIFRRDKGTINRITGCPVPVRPNAHIVVTAILDNGSGLCRVSASGGHSYSTGNTVYIDEVVGTIEANGKWTITVINATTFDLVGSTFTNTYTSGGVATTTPISIVKVYTFQDTDGIEYEILVGKDSNNLLRVYVYDSAWVELSRSFTAAINEGAGIGASDTNFDFDTLQENAVNYTGAADFVNNWVCVNTTQSNETVFITDSTASNLTVDTVVGSNGLGWANDDVIQIYRFPCFKFNYTFDHGATPFVSFLGEPTQRKVAIFHQHTDGTKYQAIQVMKRDARNYFYTAFGGSAQRTLPAGWYCESDFGMLNPFYGQEGTIESPNTTFDANLHIVSGATNATPIVVTLSSVTGLANGDSVIIAGVQGNTAANGKWTLANGAGSTFELANSVGNGVYTTGGELWEASTNSIYDKTSGRQWLNIYVGKSASTVTTLDADIRLYVTVSYRDYQESDPVFQGYYRHTTGAQISISVGINFALMNKEVTSINFYAASANSTVVSEGWNDAADEYYLTHQFKTQTDSQKMFYNNTEDNFWRVQSNPVLSTPYYGYKLYNFINGGSNSVIAFSSSFGQTTILQSLNHAPDKNRSYPTPRYGVKMGRTQGAVSIIDVDDNTLRFSLWDGTVNQDDNFPDLTATEDAVKLKLFLTGSGEILGIEKLNDIIQIIRQTERLFNDPQSTEIGSVPCDCVSRESIVGSKNGFAGLSWVGNSGIYLLPSSGSQEQRLSNDIQNKIDGTLLVTGTTPYITSTYKEASVGGWDEANKTLMFVIQMNTAASTEFVGLFYNFTERALSRQPVGWWERKFNIGTDGSVKCFSRRLSDNSLTVVYDKGILKYPNTSGSYIYQDDVLINGAGTQVSQSKGIHTRFKVMCGSLYDLVHKNVFGNAKIDFTGSSISGTGSFNWLFWINKMTSAKETKGVLIDKPSKVRGLPPFGSVERFAVEANFTEGSESDLKDFIVSAMVFSHDKTPEIGNTY